MRVTHSKHRDGFTLSWCGQRTAVIAYSASANAILAALEALGNAEPGKFDVVRSGYSIRFIYDGSTVGRVRLDR